MTLPARYRDPLALDRLAADYLTGGMSAAAGRRAARLVNESPEFRAAVTQWRTRLDKVALDAQGIGAPSDAVWEGIQARVAATQALPHGAVPQARPPAQLGMRPWWHFTMGAGALAIAALALAVVLVLRPVERVTPATAQIVAMLQTPSGAVGAVLMVQPDGHFSFTALVGVNPPAGRRFQLWLLPRRGAPISLGVAESGRGQYQLPRAAQAALKQAASFAVSVEPPGGSPTGQPTGPVVMVGAAHAA
ncbi:anti-sigma-K factor rskA [mine drainage metagenome]|jgi:anti-sigma-K factor RskA|uniref:Anti-sigma-K factor rskA n=1 Tax=mine drainage metagenome TaxID=410659 RepID=A0A1J5QP69_9ZZZZ